MMLTKRKLKIRKLNREIANCRKCKGFNVCKITPSAPGFGSIRANVMLIGQSLHAYNPETPIQIPFQGPKHKSDSGKILDEAFRKADVNKKELFITNVLHCHPPDNRPSTSLEVRNCVPYLMREIFIVKPRLIIPLGNDAKGVVLERFDPVFKYKSGKKCSVCPVYHPAYVYRYRSPKVTGDYVNLLVKLMRRYL